MCTLPSLPLVGPVRFPRYCARTSPGGAVTIDRASYRRYDRYAQAVAAIDANGAARVYQTLKPRIDEADRNFGGAGNFDTELERAISELLKVPVIDGDVALQPSGTGIGYVFADAKLEGLSAAQKQLLRMGPENVRTIQAKLREIANAAVALVPATAPQPVQDLASALVRRVDDLERDLHESRVRAVFGEMLSTSP